MKFCLIMILLFYIYSFLGWLAEVILTLVKLKKFINRGFLIGPLVPLYGVGSTLIYLVLRKYENDWLVLFLLSVILCATLEYLISYLMEKIFKNRWWDYSEYKYNINGRICLEFASLFGIGGVLIVYVFNPRLIPILNMASQNTLLIAVVILGIITLIDMLISLKIIVTLKNISSSIKCDSTEEITKKVKEELSNKTKFYKRLVKAFPDMKVFNKLTILKRKISKNKK